MTTTKSQLLPMQIAPGVQPSTDKTNFATQHYTQADKIRFRFGFPQKIGGWVSILFTYSATIAGYARSLFSCILSTAVDTVIGTNEYLYCLLGSQLTNITPFSTSTVAIANSLSTDYITLDEDFGNGPFLLHPIAGIGTQIFVSSAANLPAYPSGASITISGVTTTIGGVADTYFNGVQIIYNSIVGQYSFVISAIGTNGATGGGASVINASGKITVTATAHGMSNGQRVKITGAGNTGGISSTLINDEFVIFNVTANTFDIMTNGTATSAVTAAGGSGTTYAPQLATGNQNQSVGQGYGMGLYGQGLYGTALQAAGNTFAYPRIWFFDRFGVYIVMTAGNQTGVYSWAGASTTAPVLIANAPTAVNYAFVSNNILVTFGNGGVVNEIFASDQANMTQWTSSSTNQVFQDTVNGAGQLKSHVPVQSVNLIFTDHQTYLFQYIGLPLIWNIQLLENNIGLIAPMARVAVLGTAYWMDFNGFFMWAGGNITPMPSNLPGEDYSTILNYVFGNINNGQASKCFAWYNEQFNEIWFHYPSASSQECNMVARYHVIDQTWVPDTFDRICAEYPNLTLAYPRLISSGGTMYAHEQGTDADGSPMPWSLTTNLRGGSNILQRAYGIPPTTNSLLTGFVPDSVQTGDINVEIIGQRYPQSSVPMYDENFTVTPTTEFVTTEIGARLWKYKISGDALGQEFIAGQWSEFVQPGSPQ